MALNKFFSSFRLLFIGSAAAGIINFIGVSIAAKLLDPEFFGVFSVYAAVISIISVVAPFRLDVVIFKENERYSSVVLTSSLVFIFLVSIIVYVVFSLDFVSGSVLGDSVFSYTPLLLSIGIASVAVYQMATSFALKYKLYSEVAISRTVQALVGSALQVSLAIILSPSFLPLILGFIAGQALGFSRLVKGLKLKLGRRFVLKALIVVRRNLKFCSVSSISVFLLILSPMLPAVIIAKNIGTVEAGVFFFATQIVSIPFTFFRRILANVMMAEFSVLAAGGYVRFVSKFARLGILAVTSFLLFLVFYYLYAKDIFGILFGSEWALAGYVGFYLLVMYFFDSFAYSAYQLLSVWGRHGVLFLIEIFRFCIVVGGVLLVSLLSGDLMSVVVWFSLSMSLFYICILFVFHRHASVSFEK